MIFAKKYEKPGFCLIGCVKIIQYQICEGSHNPKILQLEKQHEAAKFQNSLIYCFFINVQNVKYILSDTYFCPNSNKLKIKRCKLKKVTKKGELFNLNLAEPSEMKSFA